MNIGFDAKRAFFNATGLGNYSRNLIRSMIRFFPENRYHLYTPKAPKIDFLPRGLHYRVHTPGNRIIPGTFWRSLMLSGRLEKDHIDLYHGLSHEIPPGLKNRKIRSVVTIHDLIFLKYPELYPWLDRKIYLAKFGYSCKHSDAIVAISEQTKSDIIHYFDTPAEKIRVVYQNCNPGLYHPVSEAEKQKTLKKYEITDSFLLYTGSLIPRKKALNLVKAFHRVNPAGLELILAGSGRKYKAIIEEYIMEHDLGNRVKVLSNVDDLELAALYQSCLFFCYPSVYEGFGIPVIEALQNRKAVLAGNSSCFKEAGGLGALMTDPDNDDEMATNLRLMVEDEGLREKMAVKGHEYVQQFNEENFASNMMAVYTGT